MEVIEESQQGQAGHHDQEWKRITQLGQPHSNQSCRDEPDRRHADPDTPSDWTAVGAPFSGDVDDTDTAQYAPHHIGHTEAG